MHTTNNYLIKTYSANLHKTGEEPALGTVAVARRRPEAPRGLPALLISEIQPSGRDFDAVAEVIARIQKVEAT